MNILQSIHDKLKHSDKPPESRELVPPVSVKVQSQLSYRYVYKQYVFEPTAIVDVAVDDLPELLAKTSRGGGCCGSRSSLGQPLFREV